MDIIDSCVSEINRGFFDIFYFTFSFKCIENRGAFFSIYIYRQKIRTLNIKIWNIKIESIEYISPDPFKLSAI